MVLSPLAGELVGAGTDDVVVGRCRPRHDGPFLRQIGACAPFEFLRIGDVGARLGFAEQCLLFDDPGMDPGICRAAGDLPAGHAGDDRADDQPDDEIEQLRLCRLPSRRYYRLHRCR
jgi:hypothetical protein